MRKLKGRLSRGFWLFAVLGALLVLISLAGLGLLRFRVTSLAWQLDRINLSIQRYANEETRLKQELSAIVAPIKIYTYCKERLGMQKVLKAETLPVFTRQDQQVASTQNQSNGWFASISSWMRKDDNQ